MKLFLQLRKMLANDNGITLVMVLMILTVLSLLGVSLLAITVNNAKLSAVERENQAVYYIAEAGATYRMNQIESLLRNDPPADANELISELNKLPSPTFEPVFDNLPMAEITVSRDNGSYIITSTGKIGGRERTVARPFTLNWNQQNRELELPADNIVIYANSSSQTSGNINLNGSINLNGAIGTNASDDVVTNILDSLGNSFANNIYLHPDSAFLNKDDSEDVCAKLSGAAYRLCRIFEGIIHGNLGSDSKEKQLFNPFDATFHLPKFPEFPSSYQIHSLAPTMEDEWQWYILFWRAIRDQITINENNEAEQLKVNRDLTLRVNGKKQELIVDNLFLDGKLKVEGGDLTIFVRKKLEIEPESVIESDGSLAIYYEGNRPVTLSDTAIEANLFVKNTAVTITNQISMQGALVVDSNHVKIHTVNQEDDDEIYLQFLYAPFSKLELKGRWDRTSTINGTFIIGDFHAKGSYVLNPTNYNLDEFPFANSGDVFDISIDKQPLREK